MSRVFIRIADMRDAAACAAIYAPYVSDSIVSFEYTPPTPDQFADRIVSTLDTYPFLVAVDENGMVVGYCYAGPFKMREAYAWSVESTVYVCPEAKGTGVAQRLYDALFELLARMNITNVNACIAFPNPASTRFHEKCGFTQVAHFTKCGFKLGTWQDMVWMEKMIGPHKVPPEKVVPFSLLRDKTISV